MAELPPSRDRSPGTAGADAPPPAPRWVKAFGLVLLVLVVLFVVLHLARGGFRGHGP